MKKIVFLLYFLFLISLTVFSYFFIDPNLFYLRRFYTGLAFERKISISILYLIFIFLFFFFYFFFWRLFKKKKMDPSILKKIIGLTVIVLFFSYPAMLSYDIFNYLTTAKVLFFYRENPYIVMPIEFRGDELLLFTRAANKTALYGPSWLLLTGFPYLLSFGNVLLALLNFKILIFLFYFGTAFLIFKLSKNWFSVFLFALNPLVIIETLVSLHNDIVMIFLALLSFLFLMKKKIWPALIFLILSILIKYAALFLIPVFIYGVFKIFKKQPLPWEKIFYFSAILMLLAFLLSPIREEIYSWYALWFFAFVSLIPSRKNLLSISLALLLGLLLRYIPYLFSGTYSGLTPFFKEIFTFSPPFFVLVFLLFKDKLWVKSSS